MGSGSGKLPTNPNDHWRQPVGSWLDYPSSSRRGAGRAQGETAPSRCPETTPANGARRRRARPPVATRPADSITTRFLAVPVWARLPSEPEVHRVPAL